MFESYICRTKEELEKLWKTREGYLFEGYIWLCESGEKPILLNREKLPSWDIFKSNFIWEMNAYAYADEKLSLSIRFLGGCWVINTVDWRTDKVPADQLVPHVYLTKQFTGKIKLKFEEFWQPEPDPLCADMKVLTPSWIAFKGFEHSEQFEQEVSRA